ncbi:MAG TPA: hypothetical protein VFG72_14580 [Marmoricola sp.]|nr:hypothetical protein [Marmoricola sp.]
MNTSLRAPGGRLGLLSVISTYVLGFFGLLGVVTLTYALIFDTEFWSDTKSDQAFGLCFFAVVLLGAIGFVIMEQHRALGAVLGVLGGVALATILVWLLVPILLGLGAAVVAVMRARALPESPTTSRAAVAS